MKRGNSMQNDLLMILMRGIPSTGKSYRAKELAGDTGKIFSADDYWGKTREEYIANWKREKLFLAHKWCQGNVRKAAEQGEKLIIVDNTNIKAADMSVYVKIALEFGYKLQIETPTSPWWMNDIAPYLNDKVKHKSKLDAACQLLHEKNKETHGVPLETMLNMMQNFQPNITVEDLINNQS